VRGSDHPTVKSVTRERWAAGKGWVAWPRLRCFWSTKMVVGIKTKLPKEG